MKNVVTCITLILGASVLALATPVGPFGAPEIDPGSAHTAIALACSLGVMFRSRLKK